MRAIERCQPVRIPREVGRSPIEKYAEPGLVAAVHKFHEIAGRAKTTGGSEIAECLITPGPVVGMLHDRKELYVRITQIFYIWNELIGQFTVAEPAAVFFRDAAPRT